MDYGIGTSSWYVYYVLMPSGFEKQRGSDVGTSGWFGGQNVWQSTKKYVKTAIGSEI